ncbi:PAS domain S-box protein [Planktothrix agardhii]|uniref:PAS domain S-box protein n=1 Tax=Planktothrix agardhii TaxID=1160 RepID=UPI00041DBC69|nr:PAS domain S-box protein [Planktothrix agardhii]
MIWSENLETAVIPDPITVTPDTPLDQVIELITHTRSICYPTSLEFNLLENAKKEGRGSCVIIVDNNSNNRPIGIVTERNIIHWIATGKNTTGVKVAEVMSQPVVTLQYLEPQDIFSVIEQFHRNSIRHIPVVNQDKLVGLITYDTIISSIEPANLLRFRKVFEVMNLQVICATPQTPLLNIAQLMSKHHISCVVIVEETPQPIPLGIITERDLVQFKTLKLDFNYTPSAKVMSSPLLTLRGEDTLNIAYETIESHHIGRLIVTGNQGELVGLVTRTNILQVLQPLEVYHVIEVLQKQVKELQDEIIELLEDRNLNLEKQVMSSSNWYETRLVPEYTPDGILISFLGISRDITPQKQLEEKLHQQVKLEKILYRRTEKKLHDQNQKLELLADITLNIRQSLQLGDILQAAVTEIRQILDCDRVLIYRIFPNGSGKTITESVIFPDLSILDQYFTDETFSSECERFYEQRKVKAIDNIEAAYPSDRPESLCMRALMQQLQVKSKLIIPIFQNQQLWGLMLAHQCFAPHKWTEFEIEIMQQISDQVGIALAQAQLLIDLQASQEQLQDLFENASDLIQLISSEDGHFIYVNRAWKETLKYSDEDIKNLSVFDIIDFNQTPKWRQIFEQLKNGTITKQNLIETRFLTKTGEIVILEGSANCQIKDGKPTVIQSFFHDVTAKKQAEEQLQKALKELTYHKLALDEMAIVVITDANGLITYVNDKFCQLFQYSPEESLGKTHNLINSGYHPPSLFQQLWLTISQGKVWQGEIRNQAKNGDYYWVYSTIVPFVNQEDRPFQYLSIMLDITERKLAEAKLLELNQFQQAILDGANYAIISTDINGIIQVWNRAAENLLGYQAEEIIGKKTPAIIHNSEEVIERSYSLSLELGTEIAPGFEVFVAKSRLGQKEEREWIYVHKDGTHFPVLLSVSSLRDQTGNISGFLGIAQDLRERKRTEAEIKVAQERFQLAIQAAQDGFWDWDFVTGNLYLSPRWKEMIGYNNDELPNQLSSWDQVIFAEDKIAATKLIEDYNQGRIDRFEAVQRFHHKNGSTIYTLCRAVHLKDNLGNVIRMVGAHTDITEPQKAQEALKQQLAAIEAAIDGIAILKDGQYIYLNQAHVELFGYTHPEELLEKGWTALYKPEQLDYFQQHIFPILSEQRNWQGEATAQRKDGSIFTEEVSLTLTDDDLLICVCRDVTERLKAEEKIKASLLEKEVLLREIHHRVKNNLYVISNLLDLQADTLEQEEQRNLFAESQNRIQTMALIHEQLYQSNDLSQVNFANYIQNLVEKLSLSYQTKHCQVEIILDVQPVTLSLESAIPCGLLINELVTNSFKYAFPNSQYGAIKIELKLEQKEQIFLKISDNGIGIPNDFDWEDTPSLGLRLVSILADQLEASLEVDCSNGTSFTLIFQEQSYN